MLFHNVGDEFSVFLVDRACGGPTRSERRFSAATGAWERALAAGFTGWLVGADAWAVVDTRCSAAARGEPLGPAAGANLSGWAFVGASNSLGSRFAASAAVWRSAARLAASCGITGDVLAGAWLFGSRQGERTGVTGGVLDLAAGADDCATSFAFEGLTTALGATTSRV
jgi:hypothetical protein